ncbi:hypothetical protein [Arthrobacter sp. JSM 101049]|uniref:hypothetical protein n=1 Tax=Arthrobacter sp. JSM 101049 TaxID=929097 RepID=UPI003566B4C4
MKNLPQALYELNTELPTHTIDLFVTVDGIINSDRWYVVTAECFDVSGNEIGPKELDWSVSKTLGAAFVYLPQTSQSGAIKLKTIRSRRAVSRVKLSISPWKLAEASYVEFSEIWYSYAAIHFDQPSLQITGRVLKEVQK